MNCEIVLSEKMARQLDAHLLGDRSREQMAVTLCGISRVRGRLRLLGRHLILLPPDAYRHQSCAGLELRQDVQSYILRLAASERLSQVDWHSHPGSGPNVGFSGVDDHHERELAQYLMKKLPGTYYASVVVNATAIDARLWITKNSKAFAQPVSAIYRGSLKRVIPCSAKNWYSNQGRKLPIPRSEPQTMGVLGELASRLRMLLSQACKGYPYQTVCKPALMLIDHHIKGLDGRKFYKQASSFGSGLRRCFEQLVCRVCRSRSCWFTSKLMLRYKERKTKRPVVGTKASQPLMQVDAFWKWLAAHWDRLLSYVYSSRLGSTILRRLKSRVDDPIEGYARPDSERFSRQVLAFGKEFQARLNELQVGIVGLGGLGSIMVEELMRLGVSQWVLVDDDHVETSNLNRVTGAFPEDARNKQPKVEVAARNITSISPDARVLALNTSVTDPPALQHLKGCDLLIVCTDNHSSRLVVNGLAIQYLIPLLHVGFVIETDDSKRVSEVSGEYALPPLGEWCLFCSGIIDSQAAGWELASPQERENLRRHGYVKDTPAPAVYHLDGIVASLAVAEVHNLVHPYRPQHRYVTYNDLTGELMQLNVPHQEDCPVCSPEGIIGLGDLEPLPNYQRSGKKVPSVPKAQVKQSLKENVGMAVIKSCSHVEESEG